MMFDLHFENVRAVHLPRFGYFPLALHLIPLLRGLSFISCFQYIGQVVCLYYTKHIIYKRIHISKHLETVLV